MWLNSLCDFLSCFSGVFFQRALMSVRVKYSRRKPLEQQTTLGRKNPTGDDIS